MKRVTIAFWRPSSLLSHEGEPLRAVPVNGLSNGHCTLGRAWPDGRVSLNATPAGRTRGGRLRARLRSRNTARNHARGLDEPMSQAPLHLHSQALRSLGDDDEAAELFTQSIELNRRIG